VTPERTDGGRGRARIDPAWAIALTALILFALAAWRSTLGMTLLDDSYYAGVTLRLAQGARLFADEMQIQSLGFLAAVPFAKLWTALFGMTGFVAALRVFYVALAGVVGAFMYRMLRTSFGRWAALAAVAAPLLAPAYNLLAVSYDTMAALGMMLAVVLCFKALRDSSRWAAAGAGAAAAFACVSYPPFILVAVVLLVTFAVLARGWRLTGPMAIGAAVVAVGTGAWLLSRAPIADFRLTYEYVFGAYSTAGPSGRLLSELGHLWQTLAGRWGVPVWAWYAPAAAVSAGCAWSARGGPERQRPRGLLAALLPAALVLPAVANRFALGGGATFYTLGGSYLIAFVLFALPGIVAGLGTVSADTRHLLLLALPAGLVGFVLVSVFTSASILWASGVAGLAPLAMAVVAWWMGEVGRLESPLAEAAAALGLALVLVALLFGTSFKDGAPLTLHDTIRSGPYAGVTTTASLRRRVAAFEAVTAKWVGPTTGVLFFGYPGGYVLQRGVMVTNAVWLNVGPVDRITIDYYDRTGRWPDVAFVPSELLTATGASTESAAADPLLAALAARYHVVERAAAIGYTVMLPDTATKP
jgi:hypothetical protein